MPRSNDGESPNGREESSSNGGHIQHRRGVEIAFPTRCTTIRAHVCVTHTHKCPRPCYFQYTRYRQRAQIESANLFLLFSSPARIYMYIRIASLSSPFLFFFVIVFSYEKVLPLLQCRVVNSRSRLDYTIS